MLNSPQFKICFAVEPLPVRSGPGDFELPFLHFCSIADALTKSGFAEAYIIATDYLIDKYKIFSKGIRGSSLGFDQSWPKDWYSNWCEILLDKNSDVADRVFDFISNESIDVLFLWSKNDTLRNAALKSGARVIHVEMSPVRSPTGMYWIFDPLGVGPDSMAFRSISEKIEQKIPLEISSLKIADLMSGQDRQLNKTNHRKKILFPLQTENDINNILWNPFGNQFESTKAILETLSEDERIDLTVRQHPASDQDYSELVKKLAPKATYVSGKIPIFSSLSFWDGVIHVNSSVGFEAKLLAMDVCTLGSSWTSKMVPTDLYRSKIKDFLESVITGKNRNSILDAVHCFHVLESMFLVADYVSNKPSLYGKIVESISAFTGASEDWFLQCGLNQAVSEIWSGVVESEIFILRGQNHLRFVEIDSINNYLSAYAKQIIELQHENQIRIDEIAEIKKLLRRVSEIIS